MRTITETHTGKIISDTDLTLEYLYVGDYGKELPHYYCNLHNPNPDVYPTAPGKKVTIVEEPIVEPDEPEEPDDTDNPYEPDDADNPENSGDNSQGQD